MTGERVELGPLRFVTDGVELRDLELDGERILDRLYFAVRDPDWGTVEFVAEPSDGVRDGAGYRIERHGETTAPGPAITATLTTTADIRSLRVECRTRARADAWVNRIGFCLLHPMAFAGRELRVGTPNGDVDAAFPARIAPHSPFTDLTSLAFRAGAFDVAVEFEGDEFEMEDQRNWIDASYKTFSTPLSHPHPRLLPADVVHVQAVTIRWRPASPAVPAAAETLLADVAPAEVGIGASRTGPALTAAGAALLGELEPAWLAVTLLLDRPWRVRWDAAVAEARLLGCPLDVSLVAEEPAQLDAWFRELDRAGTGDLPPLRRIAAYDLLGHVSRRELVAQLRVRRDEREWSARASLAGGARSNFTELNRAREILPLEWLDEVTFAANAQVHAVDDDSILQTPRALAVCVRDALAFAGERPVVVGPLTLKPTFNAVAADPRAHRANPPDPRQHTPLAAEWASAALAACGAAGGATIFETIGGWGLLDADGRPSPAFHAVLASRART